ncbi:DUF3995 domain-containing protein [Streptomyces sp. NPDC001922]|uniref:DUF3995 domain-containing protein n=1 Tax=Streptomyces sp. NPDC001922 TaxID=3364624 RepID=UPI0036ACFB0B
MAARTDFAGGGGMGTGSKPTAVYGRAASLWAAAFAALHFYWALGGDRGLSVSAGEALAAERPPWFVVFGLWGVGLLCLAAALPAWLLTRPRPGGIPGLLVSSAGWGIGILLLARGIGIEVLLLAASSGQVAAVSPEQRTWSLALWNPWFVVGGLAFGLAALRYGKHTATGPVPAS